MRQFTELDFRRNATSVATLRRDWDERPKYAGGRDALLRENRNPPLVAGLSWIAWAHPPLNGAGVGAARILVATVGMVDTDVCVRDLMRMELMTLAPNERLHMANDLMKLGRVRHMPVVVKGRLVGIVTQRDLFRAAMSSVLQFRARAEREWLEHISVAEVMTKDVVTARSDWTVRQAVDVMLERGFGCLPVVDDEALLGLLTETDCLRFLARLLAPAATTGLGVPTS